MVYLVLPPEMGGSLLQAQIVTVYLTLLWEVIAVFSSGQIFDLEMMTSFNGRSHSCRVMDMWPV
jgi:hypothetical protein